MNAGQAETWRITQVGHHTSTISVGDASYRERPEGESPHTIVVVCEADEREAVLAQVASLQRLLRAMEETRRRLAAASAYDSLARETRQILAEALDLTYLKVPTQTIAGEAGAEAITRGAGSTC